MQNTSETLAARVLRTLKSLKSLQTRDPSFEEIERLADEIGPQALSVRVTSDEKIEGLKFDAYNAICALASSVKHADGHTNDHWQSAITKVQAWQIAGG